MASAGKVAAELQRIQSQLPTELVVAAYGHIAEAHAILLPLAVSSSQSDVHQTVVGLGDTLRELERLSDLFAAIRQAVDGLVRALIGSEHGAAPAGATHHPRSDASSAAKPGMAGTDDWRAAELLAKLPVRDENHRKTSGYWVDDDRLEHGPLISARDDGYQEANEELRRIGIAAARGELWT
ncbi:MAG: hypothetical protein M3443_12775, partial [Actinomycetota bacterium]|nr:hypothetical protein [Actinomycetota bacterium]